MHLEVMELLLARDDIEVNSNWNGRSPLSYATEEGNLDVMKLLLARDDINVNWKDGYGRSPLSYAAEKGNLEVMKLLLARDDIDVNSKDNMGQLPLTYAAGRSEIVQLLMVRITAGLSSLAPNDILASPAMMSSPTVGAEQHPFHHISEKQPNVSQPKKNRTHCFWTLIIELKTDFTDGT